MVALLEGLRRTRPETRAFFASSSEIFAGADEHPQSETTRPSPLTPYGAAKAFGLYTVQSFRRRYGVHASAGILFNHESPRRPPHFVTRKITRAAAAISLGLEDHLLLGNLDAKRDWGFAGDYVRAMQLMVRAEEADDYVVATGEARTVRELVEAAFRARRPRLARVRPLRRVAGPRRNRRARARRRRRQGSQATGVEARGQLRRTGHDDGSGRPNNLHVRFRPVMKRALITGITGQDGSYLAELLLEKGYEVFGMVRRASTESVRADRAPRRARHAAPGRPARPGLARRRCSSEIAAARGLQPRGAELRADVVEPAGADGGVHRRSA